MTPGAGIFRTELPKGFAAAGINCGVRRYRPDLGIIISESDCTAAAVFTLNAYKAAPVKYCEKLLPAANIRAIITNSGQANAATGQQGWLDNQKMADAAAQQLQCDAEQVLTASTGVIGEALAIEKITQAIPELLNSVSNLAEKFALAILTTDLMPKTVYKQIELSQGQVHITGICKGAGMIHPNMATMLGYILTDAKLTVPETSLVLNAAVDKSFNMISVDGETSTNDTVFLLANGQSEVKLATAEDQQQFQTAVTEVAVMLAKSIVRDGEGATKLIEVCVQGAPDVDLAKKIARSLTVSPLLKTAIYGESPNWGRIIARIGAENIKEELLEQCQIHIQDLLVFPAAVDPDRAELKTKMREDTIKILVDFAAGEYTATAWGCDLTEKYVKINAEYVT